MLKVSRQSGGFTPWNEICPKNYLSLSIPVDPLWQNSCNLSYTACPPEFLPAVLLAGWRISLGFTPRVVAKRKFTSLRFVYPPLEDSDPWDLFV
jgi:hypothetical protein